MEYIYLVPARPWVSRISSNSEKQCNFHKQCDELVHAHSGKMVPNRDSVPFFWGCQTTYMYM